MNFWWFVLPFCVREMRGRSHSGHYNNVIMSVMGSQITSLTIVYSSVYSRCRSKKTSKLRVTGLCAGISPVAGEFPAQTASKVESVSIWGRHHEYPWKSFNKKFKLFYFASSERSPHIWKMFFLREWLMCHEYLIHCSERVIVAK